MQVPSIYVFTHDSIGLGEDGPTHQPVEHIPSLRAIPGLTVIRPADTRETLEAWAVAIQNAGPTALILSRQDLRSIAGTKVPYTKGVGRGGIRTVLGSVGTTMGILLVRRSRPIMRVMMFKRLGKRRDE